MRRTFKTQAEARMAVFEFIEGFYNPRRRHSSLGYLSPVDYERHHTRQADPGAHHAAVVLRPLKMRPGNVTAQIDRPCARRRVRRVGRDQGTGSAGGTNKGTGQDKEDPHQIT
jgi:Integrase core domain